MKWESSLRFRVKQPSKDQFIFSSLKCSTSHFFGQARLSDVPSIEEQASSADGLQFYESIQRLRIFLHVEEASYFLSIQYLGFGCCEWNLEAAFLGRNTLS